MNTTNNTPSQVEATSLQAKILAVNTVNAHTEQIVNHELSQLNKYIGQNILKVDGSFKAKINHVKIDIEKINITAFGCSWWIESNYYFSASHSRLTLNIRTCVSGGGYDKNGVNKHCIYENNRIDIFNIDNAGKLQAIEDFSYINAQYNEAEILEAKKAIEKAAEQYRQALKLMPYEFQAVTYCERLTR